MRLLFVSGTSIGGAARSTHELASALHDRGHDVVTLMRIDEARRRARAHKKLVNLGVKLGEGGAAARSVEAVARRVGSRLRVERGHEYRAWRAAVPGNAVAGALRSALPDVVIVSSVEPREWRGIHAQLAARGVPAVLYMREATALRHLDPPVARPALLLSNAEGHAREARRRGYESFVVPSVVDTGRCRVESTRERAVMVNPRPEHGLELVLALAEARPDVPFTLVESWPLAPSEVQAIERRCESLGNVQLQRFGDDPRRVYEKARMLLVPYEYEGRPRVVLEAQASGIPAIATARSGPAEAVGPGGLLVAPGAPLSEWIDALARVWDDHSLYDELVEKARSHAERDEVNPRLVVARFEDAIRSLTETGTRRR